MAMKVKEPEFSKTVVKFQKRKTKSEKKPRYIFVLGKGKIRTSKVTNIVPFDNKESLSSKPNVDRPPLWVQTKVASRNQKAANDKNNVDGQAASIPEEPPQHKTTYERYIESGKNVAALFVPKGIQDFLLPGMIPCSELDNNPKSESFRLRSWLYSYTGMGMDYDRPVSEAKYYRYVSDANPARFNKLDISDAKKRELLKRAAKSRAFRQKTKGCQYEDHRGQNYRGPLRVDILDCWIELAKANQQWIQRRAYRDQYQAKIDKEPTNKLFKSPPRYKFHDSFVNSERRRLNEWLYRRDFLNQWVDVGPALYHSFVAKGFYGSRNEGERAAEFASPRRFAKTSASVMSIRKAHDNWNLYLCYYEQAEKGQITFEELVELSEMIWDNIETSILIFKEIPEKAEKEDSLGTAEIPANRQSDEVSEAPVSKIIPPLDWSNQEAARVFKQTLNSQHPSGHSNEEVYSLVVKQSWKNLPGLLVKVPQSFNMETGAVDLAVSMQNDKLTHLKTG